VFGPIEIVGAAPRAQGQRDGMERG